MVSRMTDCKESCWCKKFPRHYSEWYEALLPVLEKTQVLESMIKIHLDKYLKTNNDLQERTRKCEKVLFSRNPHKCPICLGKRVVDEREVNDCQACHATGIVWGWYAL